MRLLLINLTGTPEIDFMMMAGKQNFGHAIIFAFIFENFGTGVDIGAGNPIFFRRIFITQNAGNLAGNRVNHYHRRQFAAGQNKRADGNFLNFKNFLNPRVYSFIATANDNEVLFFRLKLLFSPEDF